MDPANTSEPIDDIPLKMGTIIIVSENGGLPPVKRNGFFEEESRKPQEQSKKSLLSRSNASRDLTKMDSPSGASRLRKAGLNILSKDSAFSIPKNGKL
jgi:hypothetical protein